MCLNAIVVVILATYIDVVRQKRQSIVVNVMHIPKIYAVTWRRKHNDMPFVKSDK
jgi:hypothetical protein